MKQKVVRVSDELIERMRRAVEVLGKRHKRKVTEAEFMRRAVEKACEDVEGL